MIGALLVLILAGGVYTALRVLTPVAENHGRKVAAGRFAASHSAWQLVAILSVTVLPLCVIAGWAFAESGQGIAAGLVLFAMTGGIIALALHRRFKAARAGHKGGQW
ncbi:MAG: hypothetical protein CSA72_04230 [Rhodobacterales bacterium]|nr:MAG: hypothetical protein CSA72_04230 [Rhodobacterales bacterium]